MTPQRFRTLLAELIDENPFAIRAVLKILDVEFTEHVPTMAVTREHRPRLLVNLSFVKEALRHRRSRQGRDLPRVPACPSLPHGGQAPADTGAPPRVRRGDQCHHPSHPRAVILLHDGEVLREGGRYPAHPAADEQTKNCDGPKSSGASFRLGCWLGSRSTADFWSPTTSSAGGTARQGGGQRHAGDGRPVHPCARRSRLRRWISRQP